MEQDVLFNVSSVIQQVGPAVKAEDIEHYERQRRADDSSYKVRTIVEAWNTQQTTERKMRQGYAIWILVGLGIEILIANVAFFLIGFNIMSISEWVANSFFIGVFGEVVGILLIIVRYLFPKNGTNIPDVFHKL